MNAPANAIPNDPPPDSTSIANLSPKTAGAIGLATIVLGNIATLLGTVGKINEQVQRIQEQLHLDATPYLLYLVLVLIAGGYFLSISSLFKKRIHAMSHRRSAAVVLLVLVCAVGAAAANYRLIVPNKSTPLIEGRLPLWGDKLAHAGTKSGGITILLEPGPSNPVQVLTTGQAVTAMESSMSWDDPKEDEISTIRNAFTYIASKRASNGGWGYFDNSQPIAEAAGWVIVARAKAIEHADRLWSTPADQQTQLAELDKDLAALMMHFDTRTAGWSPFPLKSASPAVADSGACTAIPTDLAGISSRPPTRSYSTIMAVWALVEANRVPMIRQHVNGKYEQELKEGLGALLETYRPEVHGWVPNPNRPNQKTDSLGLTAQTIVILYRASTDRQLRSILDQPRWKQIRQDFAKRSVAHQLIGDNSHLSDVDGYVFPYPQPLEPITFLWSPWSALAFKLISEDPELDKSDRQSAAASFNVVTRNYNPEFFANVESGPTYELAENLYCLHAALKKHPQP